MWIYEFYYVNERGGKRKKKSPLFVVERGTGDTMFPVPLFLRRDEIRLRKRQRGLAGGNAPSRTLCGLLAVHFFDAFGKVRFFFFKSHIAHFEPDGMLPFAGFLHGVESGNGGHVKKSL